MTYQDTWVNGGMVQKGTRSCAERYGVIKSFCEPNPPKTVLDIGANMCYFGLRLIEDFGCNVIAFEYDHFELRKTVVDKNATDKLILLNRKISLRDLEILNSFCHFDLVLALSVLHHVPGEVDKWIEQLRKLGTNVIIEFALGDSKRTSTRKNYSLPDDHTVLGYGDSHLKKDFKRPIVLL